MSEPIQSIATGTYMIGETSNLNFEAGPGISITQPSEGTVRIANDETVLWEGDSEGGFTLSDDPLNFKYIRIDECPYYEENASKPIYSHTIVPTTQYTTLIDGWCGSLSDLTNGYTMFNIIQFTGTNNKTLSRQGGYHKHDNSNSLASNSKIRFYKVVGVNRISGGNTQGGNT